MPDRERWDGLCERGIAGLVLAILVLSPLIFGAVQTLGLLVIWWLTLAVLGLWIVRAWVSKSPRILWTPACWFVLAFAAYAWARLPGAAVEYPAREEGFKIALYTVLFFVALNNLYRQEITQLVVNVLVGLAAVLSFYAIYQFITDSPRVWSAFKPAQFAHRGSATYICPNHFAGFLELPLALGVAFTLASRLKDSARILVGYATLVVVVGIGVTVSRGAWISTGLALCVMFIWFSRKPQFRLPALLAMGLLGAGAMYGLQKAHLIERRFNQMVTAGTPDDISSRKLIWKAAFKMWQSSPWTGLGPAQFDPQFIRFRPPELQWRPANVHNDYLNALTDYGIIGAGLIGLFGLTMAAGLMKTWKYVDRASNDLEAKASNRSAFVMGSAIGFLSLLFHAVVDFNFYIPANAVLAVVMAAILSSHLRFATDRHWVSMKTAGKVVLTVVGLAALVWLGVRGKQRTAEFYWLRTARSARTSEARLAAYREAFKVDPKNAETAYAIGEMLRLIAGEGLMDSKRKAGESVEWFLKGIQLNPFDTHNYVRLGMSLHLLGRKGEESGKYFAKAVELDPNNHFLVAHLGWHHYDAGEFERAKGYFERSLEIKSWDNRIATYYLNSTKRLLESKKGTQ